MISLSTNQQNDAILFYVRSTIPSVVFFQLSIRFKTFKYTQTFRSEFSRPQIIFLTKTHPTRKK